jgi:hypothetical protein
MIVITTPTGLIGHQVLNNLLGRSEAMAQGYLDMCAAYDQGLATAEPRTPASSTPTNFRQWCEEVLGPAVLG